MLHLVPRACTRANELTSTPANRRGQGADLCRTAGLPGCLCHSDVIFYSILRCCEIRKAKEKLDVGANLELSPACIHGVDQGGDTQRPASQTMGRPFDAEGGCGLVRKSCGLLAL